MFGANIKNSNNDVLIDSNTHNYHYAGKLNQTSQWNTSTILKESGSATHRWSSPNGLAPSQSTSIVHQYRYYTSHSSKPPLCFVKPRSWGPSSPFFSIINTFYHTGGYWEFWVILSNLGQYIGGPEIYLFATAGEVTHRSDSFGFQTLNAAGDVTFDSRYRPLRVTSAGQYISPTEVVTGSKGSGTTPYLSPNTNSQFSTGSTVPLNDVIIHCPTFSTGCCEHDYEREATYTHYNAIGIATSTYAWGRYDFWWSFYRTGIQLTSTSALTVGYIHYVNGHVWEHAYASGGFSWGALFGGLLLGGLTGGIGFGLLLGAIAVSTTVNNATISGAYLPYANSTRNANEAATYIISRASYYD